MGNFKADKIFVISNNILSETLEMGIAITKPGTDRLIILNATASEIWQLLDGATPLANIILQLAQRYNQNPDMIAQDVEKLINRMLAAGLIIESVK